MSGFAVNDSFAIRHRPLSGPLAHAACE